MPLLHTPERLARERLINGAEWTRTQHVYQDVLVRFYRMNDAWIRAGMSFIDVLKSGALDALVRHAGKFKDFHMNVRVYASGSDADGAMPPADQAWRFASYRKRYKIEHDDPVWFERLVDQICDGNVLLSAKLYDAKTGEPLFSDALWKIRFMADYQVAAVIYHFEEPRGLPLPRILPLREALLRAIRPVFVEASIVDGPAARQRQSLPAVAAKNASGLISTATSSIVKAPVVLSSIATMLVDSVTQRITSEMRSCAKGGRRARRKKLRDTLVISECIQQTLTDDSRYASKTATAADITATATTTTGAARAYWARSMGVRNLTHIANSLSDSFGQQLRTLRDDKLLSDPRTDEKVVREALRKAPVLSRIPEIGSTMQTEQRIASSIDETLKKHSRFGALLHGSEANEAPLPMPQVYRRVLHQGAWNPDITTPQIVADNESSGEEDPAELYDRATRRAHGTLSKEDADSSDSDSERTERMSKVLAIATTTNSTRALETAATHATTSTHAALQGKSAVLQQHTATSDTHSHEPIGDPMFYEPTHSNFLKLLDQAHPYGAGLDAGKKSYVIFAPNNEALGTANMEKIQARIKETERSAKPVTAADFVGNYIVHIGDSIDQDDLREWREGMLRGKARSGVEYHVERHRIKISDELCSTAPRIVEDPRLQVAHIGSVRKNWPNSIRYSSMSVMHSSLPGSAATAKRTVARSILDQNS